MSAVPNGLRSRIFPALDPQRDALVPTTEPLAELQRYVATRLREYGYAVLCAEDTRRMIKTVLLNQGSEWMVQSDPEDREFLNAFVAAADTRLAWLFGHTHPNDPPQVQGKIGVVDYDFFSLPDFANIKGWGSHESRELLVTPNAVLTGQYETRRRLFRINRIDNTAIVPTTATDHALRDAIDRELAAFQAKHYFPARLVHSMVRRAIKEMYLPAYDIMVMRSRRGTDFAIVCPSVHRAMRIRDQLAVAIDHIPFRFGTAENQARARQLAKEIIQENRIRAVTPDGEFELPSHNPSQRNYDPAVINRLQTLISEFGAGRGWRLFPSAHPDGLMIYIDGNIDDATREQIREELKGFLLKKQSDFSGALRELWAAAAAVDERLFREKDRGGQ